MYQINRDEEKSVELFLIIDRDRSNPIPT